MSGLTTNFSFYLPADGDGDANSQPWGAAVNGNFVSIDTILKAHADALASVTPSRGQSTVTTPSLAPGEVWNGTLTMPKTSALLRMTTSRPAVVRAYGSAAERTADSTRPYTQPPGGGTGLQFQGTTIASVLTFSTQATLNNDDITTAATLYLSVQNLDTTSGTITLTFDRLPMEA